MPELGDFFHLIKTNRLTFGLLLNPWLVFGVSSGVPALYHMIKLKALGVQYRGIGTVCGVNIYL